MPSDLRAAVAEQRFGVRLAARDPSLWSADPEVAGRIVQRLGWLGAPAAARADLHEFTQFAREVRDEGIQHVVLLGMGGSSLCPLVAADTFGPTEGWPELIVLDSVDPAAIRDVASRLDPARTLFLVASKSGSTIETMSLYRYFHELVAGSEVPGPGSRFVALTDPGSPLAVEARERGFRRTFETPADVGGRFSALTAFGLVPMALAGYDVEAIVESALQLQVECAPEIPDARNPAIGLGLALAAQCAAGRDKLTLVASPGLSSLPLWIEQLVAESTGKDGRGIIPVADEPLADPGAYGPDRLFVEIALAEERSAATDGLLSALADDGHPVLRITLPRPETIGGEFLRWEIATAVAGAILGVNPFDEPDVTASKTMTAGILEQLAPGELPDGGSPAAAGDHLEVHVNDGLDGSPGTAHGDPAALLRDFAALTGPGDYMAVLAFMGDSPDRDELLREVRRAVRRRTGAATTVGYGPRYLHSSGQLHKGGPDTGRFLLLTCDAAVDLPIPGSDTGFAGLQLAQALGDERVLLARGRRVLRVNLGWYVEEGLEALIAALD